MALIRRFGFIQLTTIYDVWLIGYKEENRWAPAYRIRRRAVSSGTAHLCQEARKLKKEMSDTETIK